MTYTKKTPTSFSDIFTENLGNFSRGTNRSSNGFYMVCCFMMYQLGRVLSKWFLERNPEVSAVRAGFGRMLVHVFGPRSPKALEKNNRVMLGDFMMLKSPTSMFQKSNKRTVHIGHTVDARNPAPVEGMVVFPIIHKVFVHARWVFGISSINSMKRRKP